MRAKPSNKVSISNNNIINILTDQLHGYEIHSAAFAAKIDKQFTFLMIQLWIKTT